MRHYPPPRQGGQTRAAAAGRGPARATAEAPMRHNDPSLTAKVYTDPQLLDVTGAVASLPDPLLRGPNQAVPEMA